MGAWLTAPIGRMRFALHVGVPVAAVALWLFSGAIGARYLLLLGVLAIHELGHALAALALGARGAEVRLTPVFGWARVPTFPDRRRAAVGLAGPAANLLTCAVLLLVGAGFDLYLRQARLPDFLFTTSAIMGVGNLLPIPPLDGGRALAALRTRRN